MNCGRAVLGVELTFVRLLTFVLTGILLATVGISTSVEAQDPPAVTANDQMGLMPYASYHSGDIDTVSLATGNLVVKVPFLNYPQRGNALKVQFDLLYNGHPFQLQNICVAGQYGVQQNCKQYWAPAGSYSWDGDAPSPVIGVNVVDSEHVTLEEIAPPFAKCGNCTPIQYSYPALFKVMTPDNGSHLLGLLPGSGGNCGPLESYWESNWGTFESLDATGWQAQIPQPSNCSFSPIGTIIGPNGVQHLNNDSLRQDSNGNQIAVDGTGAITDTLNRQIPRRQLLDLLATQAHLSARQAH